MDIILIIGQALFGGYFVYSAYNHFAHTDALAGYAASKGVPQAKLAVLGSGLLIFAGGLSVFLGVRPELGAWAIVLFLALVTYKMHAFWQEEGQAKEMQKIQFGKNVALIGAALMFAALYF
jgi:uncharacterized membrane protein YphA (DoxX/SURF4 family)